MPAGHACVIQEQMLAVKHVALAVGGPKAVPDARCHLSGMQVHQRTHWTKQASWLKHKPHLHDGWQVAQHQPLVCAQWVVRTLPLLLQWGPMKTKERA